MIEKIINKRPKNLSVESYRDEDAFHHQEVVTPTELVNLIYSYLKNEDFNGEVLDPCVGPGAMSIPLIGKCNLTVCDIQKVHINNFQEISNGDIVPFIDEIKYSNSLIKKAEQMEELDEW